MIYLIYVMAGLGGRNCNRSGWIIGGSCDYADAGQSGWLGKL